MKITDADIKAVRSAAKAVRDVALIDLCTDALPYDGTLTVRGLPTEGERTAARKEIADAIERACTVLGAFPVRVRALDEDQRSKGLIYAYHASETRSWWLVSLVSLYRFGRVAPGEEPLTYDEWAEADTTAQEWGKRAPERAS